VYDNSAHTIALYVNGVLQGTTSFSSPWKATGHTAIGRARWNGANVDFVNGAIDDVRMTGKAITASEALALGTGANAYYELDEGSGQTATNLLGTTPSGGLIGSATWAGSGKVGTNAVSLTGTNQSQITIPGAAIDTSQSYSVAAWVKLNSLTGNQTFAALDSANVSPFYLQLTGGKFAMTERSADSTSSTATTVTGLAPTTGTWYHLVGVYDASAGTVSLYVNGTLQGSASYTSAWKATGTTQIGSAWWSGNEVDWVNGQIDDVHFYNRALTTTEISELAAG
jgi:hypothetical protein